MKKRITALLLLLALLAVPLAGCSEKPGGTDGETTSGASIPSSDAAAAQQEDEETELVTDNLPERDFGGFSYNIYTRTNTTHYLFTTEEMSGEVLNDTIYERNEKVAERFNVVFTETEYSDQGMAANNVKSGDNTFSLMNVRCTAADTMAQKGYCFNISTLNFIDLTKPYWDKEMTDSIRVGSAIYTAIGATDLTAIDFMDVLLFSKDLREQYGMDDFYELVQEGKWTLDKFAAVSEQACRDLNGDGVMNGNDQWGQLGVAKYHQCSMIQGAGALYINMDENHYPVFNMSSDEHFIDVFNKVLASCNTNNAWYATTDSSNEGTEYHTMFRGNQGLFLSTIFYYIGSMRDMDHDFGILPYPKYDEAQAKYYNRVSFFDTSVIPVTVPDIDCASIVFEALTCESFNTVVPAYKEIALKSKYARDPKSSDMIDLILSNRIMDLGDTYLVESIRDGFVYNLFINSNSDVISEAKKREKIVNKNIEKMIDAYKEVE